SRAPSFASASTAANRSRIWASPSWRVMKTTRLSRFWSGQDCSSTGGWGGCWAYCTNPRAPPPAALRKPLQKLRPAQGDQCLHGAAECGPFDRLLSLQHEAHDAVAVLGFGDKARALRRRRRNEALRIERARNGNINAGARIEFLQAIPQCV